MLQRHEKECCPLCFFKIVYWGDCSFLTYPTGISMDAQPSWEMRITTCDFPFSSSNSPRNPLSGPFCGRSTGGLLLVRAGNRLLPSWPTSLPLSSHGASVRKIHTNVGYPLRKSQIV